MVKTQEEGSTNADGRLDLQPSVSASAASTIINDFPFHLQRECSSHHQVPLTSNSASESPKAIVASQNSASKGNADSKNGQGELNKAGPSMIHP